MKCIKANEISQFPQQEIYNAHDKIFLIKRQLVTHDISNGVDLSYWIYERKQFLIWKYWSSICQSTFQVSKDSIEDAKQFIDNFYPLMKNVQYYSYDY